MPEISAVEGTFDNRPGYDQPLTGDQLERAKRATAHSATQVDAVRQWLDPSVRRRDRELAELTAEAERKAGPDPRGVLREAHCLLRQAATDVEHLSAAVERARLLTTEIGDRKGQLEAAQNAGNVAAVARLVGAIEAGADMRPVVKQNGAAAAALDHAEREFAIADEALRRLEAELADARDLAIQRTHGIARCAVMLLTDLAADEANRILGVDRELAQRRHDLDALAMLITTTNRRLFVAPPRLPAQISRAISPPDPVLTGTARPSSATDWAAILQALSRDPEAHRELDAA